MFQPHMSANVPFVTVQSYCMQVNLAGNNIGGYYVEDRNIIGGVRYISTPEGPKAIADAMRVSQSLTEANLLQNEFDVETATMLAQISREKKLTLCGIGPDQTEADFKYRGLKAADARSSSQRHSSSASP